MDTLDARSPESRMDYPLAHHAVSKLQTSPMDSYTMALLPVTMEGVLKYVTREHSLQIGGGVHPIASHCVAHALVGLSGPWAGSLHYAMCIRGRVGDGMPCTE